MMVLPFSVVGTLMGDCNNRTALHLDITCHADDSQYPLSGGRNPSDINRAPRLGAPRCGATIHTDHTTVGTMVNKCSRASGSASQHGMHHPIFARVDLGNRLALQLVGIDLVRRLISTSCILKHGSTRLTSQGARGDPMDIYQFEGPNEARSKLEAQHCCHRHRQHYLRCPLSCSCKVSWRFAAIGGGASRGHEEYTASRPRTMVLAFGESKSQVTWSSFVMRCH